MMTSRENDLYHLTDRHATKIAEFVKPKLREESLFPNTNNHPEYDYMVPASWTLYLDAWEMVSEGW